MAIRLFARGGISTEADEHDKILQEIIVGRMLHGAARRDLAERAHSVRRHRFDLNWW
jgi:hypothetical protein